MRITILLFLAVALLIAGPLSAGAYAQSYREDAPISPLYVFGLMVESCDEGDINKISGLTSQISEVLSVINTKFGVDVKAQLDRAISSGITSQIKRAIETLILYDIKDVFRVTEEGINQKLSLSKLKNRLKFAYNDYLAVSKWAKKLDFALDRKIRKDFNEVITALLARAIEGDSAELKNRLQQVEVDYRSLFGI